MIIWTCSRDSGDTTITSSLLTEPSQFVKFLTVTGGAEGALDEVFRAAMASRPWKNCSAAMVVGDFVVVGSGVVGVVVVGSGVGSAVGSAVDVGSGCTAAVVASTADDTKDNNKSKLS